MAEYINREAVFEQFDNGEADVIEMYPDGSCDFGFGASNIRDMINAIPAADVAPVVRCRECEHWKPTGSKAGNSFSDMEYIGGCEFTKYCRRESDFCSYGERKEGADNG